ncbi:MAG: hypothetical protein KBA67_01175 [Leptotrichiaceae bacterium]|nr:hypothetical protein [Leptotrichiaceae bacterium]MBP6280613.1 hypothetical protein [Leptotrichiaceae bacterium]MBP7100120.1 hypothetical protein [Leptotrichiaceae bacterium]MBP7725112.1 hypothetical protein [Leptotrichiaceae bacterium]MBP9629205.1 hypothetical protein [Leptotrichiaceae bacterium]
MVTKWKKERLEKENKMLIKTSVIFMLAVVISGISYFILENKNKELRIGTDTLKSEKDKLDKDVKDKDEKIIEKEKSFKEITEKLNIK